MLPNHNFELRTSIGKISLGYFDGTSKCTLYSWIHKLDTYFQLNPMAKRYAIKMEALHLDGEANKWWFHGMNTLGHDQVATYEEFIRRLEEMFDQRDLEISFREFAHVN